MQFFYNDYDNLGKNGEEQTLKKGHKKGHKVKSFKTSHHKDESGKSEEYYDEEHDEGGNLAFNGQAGSFGENGASSFKGTPFIYFKMFSVGKILEKYIKYRVFCNNVPIFYQDVLPPIDTFF